MAPVNVAGLRHAINPLASPNPSHDVWHAFRNKRGVGRGNPADAQPVEFLGRVAVAHVQGSAQRRQRLVLRAGLPTPGSSVGKPLIFKWGAR